MIVVDDHTRDTPTEEDLKRILGKYFNLYTIKIHDCDAEDLVCVGTTSRGIPVSLNRNYVDADMKNLNGQYIITLLCRVWRRNSPVHLDMSEVAAFAPPDFVLNIIASGNGNVVDAYAGKLNAVFHKGLRLLKNLFCRETHELFDILIVSAGGELILVAERRDGFGDHSMRTFWQDGR